MPDALSAVLSSFTLVALAEIGDKSQLVCMTLAARHRHWPVLLGAVVAFTILNVLAVVFGAALAHWLPEQWVAAVVAVLFAAFGIQALRAADGDEDGVVEEKPGHGIFFTTLTLLLVAEFGDKTQLAVAGLAGTLAPLPVWVGATAALVSVSALGIWIGRTLLQRLPLCWLHRAGGGLFLLFGALAAWRAFSL